MRRLSIVVPGGIGPEASVNCSLYNRPIVPSTITVDKVTDPAGRPEGFDFTLTGPGGTQQITDLAHSDAPGAVHPRHAGHLHHRRDARTRLHAELGHL